MSHSPAPTPRPPRPAAPRPRGAWPLLAAWWRSPESRTGRALLALVIALDLILVWRAALITYWQKDFYDALTRMDAPAFWPLLGTLALLALGGLALNTSRTWFAQSIEIRWRDWLTQDFMRRWLADNAFWQLEQGHHAPHVENVDQRVAEDLRLLAANTLGLGLGLLSNAVSLFTFSAIVWNISGALTLHLWGRDWSLPGYMLWIALAYALIGSWLMEKIGGRMVRIDYEQQRAEADFRTALLRIRESAGQIALLGGGSAEQTRLAARFAAVRQNWAAVMTYTKRITLADNAYTEIGAFVPYLLQGPRVLSGALTVGSLVQITQSFMRVRVALSWFVYKYKDLALLRSALARLVEFDDALRAQTRAGADPAADPAPHITRQIAHPADPHAADCTLHGVQALGPQGQPLTALVNWRIRPGQRWLLHGPTGAGKSTLLRATAGLWSHGQGHITLPAAPARLYFAPQHSYLPPGASLRECLAYPASASAFDDTQYRAALHWACLPALAPRLHEHADWARQLSPGQQQCLLFARIWLHRPDWLFLDEATSALDEATEQTLHQRLLADLPGLTLISIAHRSSLRPFHTHHLHIPPPGDQQVIHR